MYDLESYLWDFWEAYRTINPKEGEVVMILDLEVVAFPELQKDKGRLVAFGYLSEVLINVNGNDQLDIKRAWLIKFPTECWKLV